MSRIVKTPQPPYYAVIFTSQRTSNERGYAQMAAKMVELAAQQEGYIGIEMAEDQNLGVMVSYWETLEAIDAWRQHTLHQVAQSRGKSEWYENFTYRVCKVERDL
jgi:heme-degrading monooxygenase HmoA